MKRIVAGLRGRPLPRQTYLVGRPEVPDACYEEAVQRAGLIGANEQRVSLDDPVDSVVCVVISRRGLPPGAPEGPEERGRPGQYL